MEEKKIYSQLASIQEEIGPIGKTKRNSAQGYSFRGIDDLYNNLAPIFVKHKVMILPEIIESRSEELRQQKDGSERIAFKVYFIVKFVFLSLMDGSSVAGSMAGEGYDYLDKATGKAMSNAYKYMLAEAFTIPFEDMIDSDMGDTVEKESVKTLEQKAFEFIKSSDWPEAKKTAVTSAIKAGKMDKAFLERVANGQA